MTRLSKFWRNGRRCLAAALVMASGAVAQADISEKLTDRDAGNVSLFEESETPAPKTELGSIRRVNFAAAVQGECDSCDTVCCGPTLGPCVIPRSCVLPCWAYHRTGAFAEFLYLFPGSTDFAYAIEQTDPAVVGAASPTGPVGISSVPSQPGYRVGFSVALSNCTSLLASYTRWDGDDSDVLNRNGTNILNSQFLHPSTGTVGNGSVQARAAQDMSFQFADVAYRHLWRATDATSLNWRLGFRYGNMEQGLVASQTLGVGTGLNTVRTDIDFDGYGLTTGADFERFSTCSGLLIYGKTLGSLLAGDWKASYRQTNQFGGGVIANNIEDTRVTPIWELEAGLGWRSKTGAIRVSAGYQTTFWFDAMTTRSYLDAVRQGGNQPNLGQTIDLGLGETATFNGLVTRIELNY